MPITIDAYQRLVAPVVIDDIDFGRFRDDPLHPDALRCLRYMHDIEFHTVCYLRDLLVTSAHRDPEVTAFLTFWGYEEYWHGEAIGRVLAAHGEPAGPDRIGPMRDGLRARSRVMPLLHSLGSAIAGDALRAVHMTWGAVNEWTTQAGYARLAARAGHPTLRELLQRIMRQEGRHIDFYAGKALAHLENSRRAQRLTRFALARLWQPVGSDVMPRAEVTHLVEYLFSGPDGRAMADRIDRRVDRLPGLAELRLVSRACERLAA